MLEINIPESEIFIENSNEFRTIKSQVLVLEHSLISLAKWESKWCKPFLGKEEKTTEELFDYIKCMTINQNVDPIIYNFLSSDDIKRINEYISAPMTATTFNNSKKTTSREVITAEIIYYWMVSFNIPFECQKWHLNRLLTLINVCGIKNQPPKKMSRRELATRNAALNAARRKQLGTSG